MPPPVSRDRRAFPRLFVDVPICLEQQAAIPERKAIRFGHLIDLSAGGLLAHVDGELPTGTVEVVLRLDRRTVRLRGEMVRCQQSRNGFWNLAVRFDQEDERALVWVEAHIGDVLDRCWTRASRRCA
jgi:hypothetical protein